MKQHYVPQFLLRQWVNQAGKLHRYTQPRAGRIHQRLVFPSECGFAHDLYTENGGEPWFETKALQVIDNEASKVLLKLINCLDLTPAEKHGFGIYLRSALHRSPHMIHSFETSLGRRSKQMHEKMRRAAKAGERSYTVEEIDAEFERRAGERGIEFLPAVLTTPGVNAWIKSAHWIVYQANRDCRSLLISDDYVFRRRGLNRRGGYLMMPLSPKSLLLITSCEETLAAASKANVKSLSEDMNLVTVEGARTFVAARNEEQDRFIRNHFGKTPRASLLG